MRYQFTDGQRQLVNAGRSATSDDIGQFRIFGLMPGDYIVRASVRDNGAMAAAAMAARRAVGLPHHLLSRHDRCGPGASGDCCAWTGIEFGDVLARTGAPRARVRQRAQLEWKPLGGAVVLMRPADRRRLADRSISAARIK